MKVHLNLAASDLDASVAFYRTLLAVDPAKHYTDYALFLTERPGLELALDAADTMNVADGAHYGIVVDEPSAVAAAAERLEAAGYRTRVETGQTCCYATQNKVWASDPDGRRWETYYVVAEAAQRDGADPSCC